MTLVTLRRMNTARLMLGDAGSRYDLLAREDE
jgi:hypothetical protein